MNKKGFVLTGLEWVMIGIFVTIIGASTQANSVRELFNDPLTDQAPYGNQGNFVGGYHN